MNLVRLNGPVQDRCDGFSSEVLREYVADVSSEKLLQEGGQVHAQDLHTSTMRHLSQCCSTLAKDKVPMDPEVVRITECCFQCYSQLRQVAAISILDSARVVRDLKIILYAASKLIGKASLTTYMNLSSHILGILKTITETDNELCDLITKLYSCVWNAAITFERTGQVTPLEVCLLRFSSLRILARRPAARESCLEKIALALNVFEHRWKESVEKQAMSDAVSAADAHHTVFSQVLSLLEEVVCPGEVPAHSILTLSISLYDFLTSSQCLELVGPLRSKLQTLSAEGQCKDTKRSAFSAVLDRFWAVTDIAEYLYVDLAQTERSEANFTARLKSVVRFAEQMQLSAVNGHDSERSFIDMVCWFEKQIKSRNVRKDIFVKPDNLGLLQQFFRETQKSLALYASKMSTTGKSESCPLSQSDREKVAKTHLDAHRCWLIFYHKALSEHFSPETDEYLNRVNEQAPDQLAAYAQAIDGAAHSSSLQLNERYFVGSMCVKLGHLLYNQKKDEQSVPFYSQACDQLTLWCHGDPDVGCPPDLFAGRMRETSLLKLFNCLSQSQHKAGLIDDAMATIVGAVVITKCSDGGMGSRTADSDMFAGLIATWIKLKRSALKEGGPELDARLARSFTDEATFGADRVHLDLELELHELIKGTVKPRLWPVEGAVLKRLHETSPSERRKDIYQLFLLQFDVLTNSPLETSREEIDENLDRLTRKYADHPAILAEVCLIRFCLQVAHKVAETFTLEENDPEAGEPNIGTHQKMIGEEEKEWVRAALRGLKLALETGDVCFTSGSAPQPTQVDSYSEHVQRKMFRDLLMMVADVLMACREFLLQLEVLVVVKQLMAGSPVPILDADRLEVDTGVVSALTGLGLEDLPSGLAHLTPDTDEKDAGRRDSFHLSLVSFYLQTGQVKEAYPLLNQLRDRDLKGELSSLQRGKYKRLLGECLRADPALSLAQDYVLTLAQAAYRLHFSLFSRIDTEHNFRVGHSHGDDSVWLKLQELLESTLFLGRMFRHTGDVRRARCYLKEGRALCEKFGLLKWYTVFGLELAEVLLEAEELVCFLDALWSTYSNLSRLEPQPNRLKYPKLLVKASTTKPATPTSPTLNDLAEACSRAFEEDRKQPRCESNAISICPGFWLKMQVDKLKKPSSDIVCTQLWQRMVLEEPSQTGVGADWERWEEVRKGQKEELDRKAADVVGWILSWSRFLAGHDTSCWCPTCGDAESQLLALALAKMAVKFIHRNCRSAEHHLERFFSVVVRRFKRVDKSLPVARALQAAQLVDWSVAVRCGDLRHVLCFAEVSCFLAEMGLHRRHMRQALAHVKVGFLAVSCVPQPVPEAALLKSRLVHLRAVCLHQASRAGRQPRAADWWREFSWCWLTETQLEVQVRKKLEELKVRVPPQPQKAMAATAGDKIAAGGDGKKAGESKGPMVDKLTAGSDSVNARPQSTSVAAEEEKVSEAPSRGEDVAGSSCTASVEAKSKAIRASNNGGRKVSVTSVSSSNEAIVGSTVKDKSITGGKDHEKKVIGATVSSSSEVVVGSSVKGKTTAAKRGRRAQKDASSNVAAEQSSRTSSTKECKSTTADEHDSLCSEPCGAKPGQTSVPGSAKPSTTSQPTDAKPSNSSQPHDAKPSNTSYSGGAITGNTSQPSNTKLGQASPHSTVPPNVHVTASNTDSPSETRGEKGGGASKIPVRQLVARVRKKQSKKPGVSSSDTAAPCCALPAKMDSPSSIDDSAAANEKPVSKQNWTATPFRTPQRVPSKPQETPSSLIKQVLSFTSSFSDSGDEFKPSTPMSTPRLTVRSRRAQTRRKETRPKDPSQGGRSREVASQKCSRPRRTAAEQKTSQDSVTVEALEQSFSQLGLSADSDSHGNSAAIEQESGKAKPVPKSTKTGRKPSTKTKGKAPDVGVEALQEDLVKLSLSREGDDTTTTIPDTADLVKEKPEPSAQETETGVISEKRGRRGRGSKASSENADGGGKTSSKAAAGGRRAKVLSSRLFNVPSETCEAAEDRGTVAPSIVTADAQITVADTPHPPRARAPSDKGESARRRPGRPKQLAEQENLDVSAEVIPAPPSADEKPTGRRGGRKPRDVESKPGEAPRGRRAAASKTAKNKAAAKTAACATEAIPEIEVVRGGGGGGGAEDDMEARKDIFDFDESDGEGDTSSRKHKQKSTKGRKGIAKRPAPRGKAAVSVKQVAAAEACPNTKIATSASGLASPRRDEPTSGDPRADMSSTEKMRLGDLTNLGNAAYMHIERVDRDRLSHDLHAEVGLGCAGGGCEGCGACQGLAWSDVWSGFCPAGESWHEESLLTYLQAQGKTLPVHDDDDDVGGGLPEGGALRNVQSHLARSMMLNQHFPHNSLFSESCKVLAQIKLDMGEDPWEIVALLGESAAISLRHQFLSHFHKQIRMKEAEERGKQTQDVSSLREDFRDLVFPWDVAKYKEVVRSLPQGWTVCQFTVVDAPGSQSLMLTRLTNHQEPLTVELPGFFDKKGQDIFFAFKKEIQDTNLHARITDTAKWWHRRATVDCKLTHLMEGMDQHWLQAWRGMLAGQSSDPLYNKAMSAAAGKLVKVLHKFLGYRCSHSKAMQVLELMQHTKCLATILSGVLKLDNVSENAALLSAITTDVLRVMPEFKTPDLPVVFIPDKHLANLPLEHLGAARDQAVSRVPSLSLLHHLLKMHVSDRSAWGKKPSVMQRGVDPTSVFYVLNPDGDLSGTEQILKPHFDRYAWKGVTAMPPSKPEYEEALAAHDLFIYSGHGSGSKYYSSEDVQKTACRAVAMLFGCGSVRFDLHPHLDLSAYFYSYLLAGSPCVLGNLWDVTATDIDKFCSSLCQQWLSEDGETQPNLASLLPRARGACTMQSLNGCAPVLYGLPVPLNRPKR